MNDLATPIERDLIRHPRSEGAALERVVVALEATDDELVLTYRFVGNLERLRVPTGPLDPERLWETTCAELFVARPGSDAYVEWNFSPTLQSARFAFSGYRERVETEAPAGARVAVTREPGALVLEARGALLEGARPARLGLSAVVEDDAGRLSYWALRHPAGSPDFHHHRGFALELDAVRSA